MASLDQPLSGKPGNATPGDSAATENDPHLLQDHRGKKSLSFYISFLVILIMCFLVSIDATILGVAVPVIVLELHGTTLEAFWASISFLLAVVIVQPIYTNISNVIGRMMPLYLSFIFFILGSIIFSIAHNMSTLIAGRVVQGLGAGGLDVLNEIILADMTTLKERPMYLGYLSVPMLAGTVLGPILGGLFSQFVTWRWIGWLNLPLSAVGIILAIGFLRLKAIDQPLRDKIRRIDWGGIALFTAGCTLFATPLAWAGAMFSWSSYQTLVPLSLGIILLFVFVYYESKPIEPVFPYRIFSQTAFLTLFMSFLHGIANFTVIMYIPLFFQAVYLDTPLQSAIIALPICCIAIGFAIISAVIVDWMRKYRLLILVSWVFSAVGAGIFTILDRSSTLAAKASFQVVLAMGIGPFFSLLNLPLQASLPTADDMGLAAGILVSFRLFGGLVGLAIASNMFNTLFSNRINALGQLPEELAPLYDVREAVGFIPLLRDIRAAPELLNEVIEAYRFSISSVFWMVAGASGIGFLSSFFIKENSLEKEELGRQQFQLDE